MARRATAPCPADQSHEGHIVGGDSLRRWKDRDSPLEHAVCAGRSWRPPRVFLWRRRRVSKSVSDPQVPRLHSAHVPAFAASDSRRTIRRPQPKTERKTAMKTKLIGIVSILALALTTLVGPATAQNASTSSSSGGSATRT